MNADLYYSPIDKENFYLGIISQVSRENSFVQVENLSLLRNRKIRNEILAPNTINYLVVIEDAQGLFIGEVYQSKVQDKDSVNQAINDGEMSIVFPELAIDIIGFKTNGTKFKLAGFKTVGINDKVYLANKKIIERYFSSLQIQKYSDSATKPSQNQLENIATLASGSRTSFSIRPNVLFDRHLLVVGSTNSGKSTSSLTILDRLIHSHKKVLVMDPTGEYDCSFGEDTFQHLTLGVDTFLPVEEVTMSQWNMLFQIGNSNTQGAVLADAIQSLRFQSKNGDMEKPYVKNTKKVSKVEEDMLTVTGDDKSFNLSLLPQQIKEESVGIKKTNGHNEYYLDSFRQNSNSWLIQKIQYEFANSSLKRFFSNKVSEMHVLLDEIDKFCANPLSCLYINSSQIGSNDGIGTMIIDLISNYVIQKNKSEIKPFVLFLDEVHRYTQFVNDSVIWFSGLINIAREGRKKGIFLFLTTQSPNDVPKILFGQIGTLLIHRLTDPEDLKIIQNHLDQDDKHRIIKLNQGEALLTSINLLMNVQLVFNKCGRIHHNDTPLL